MSSKIKELSAFGRAAIELDFEFQELDRLAQKIERLSLQTDSGLERASDLIIEAEMCRARLMTAMQVMAAQLEETRNRSEQSVTVICERTAIVQNRKQEAEKLAQRFQALGEMVKTITFATSHMTPQDGVFSPEQKLLLAKTLPEFNEKMDVLVRETKRLKADAREAQLSAIERSADSLFQKLDFAKQKFNDMAQQL